MRRILYLSSLIVLLIGAPLAAIGGDLSASGTSEQLQNEQPDVYLKNYGTRYIKENGNIQSIGLYKIIVGDPRKLKLAMSLNKAYGFDGTVYKKRQDQRGDWDKITVHRPNGNKKGWKEFGIVKKDGLPCPFNTMDDNLAHKIQFFKVYSDSDDVAIVYIEEGTKFSECEKMFNYIYEKKKNPGKTAGL